MVNEQPGNQAGFYAGPTKIRIGPATRNLIITTNAAKSARKKRVRGEEKPPITRQCALTKDHFPTDQLIRFALSPDHVVTPDILQKLPGRGIWLTAGRSQLEQAIKKNLFARGFKKKVVVPDNLCDTVDKLLRKQALHTLSLANKAGLVITGYEKIRSALGKRDIKALLHAQEAAPGGSDKLDRFLLPKQDEPEETDMPPPATSLVSGILPALFTGAEMSLALGRTNVIHIGLKRGDMTRRFQTLINKVDTFKIADLAPGNHPNPDENES